MGLRTKTYSLEELVVLDKKTRHIIYNEKQDLESVLRYNSGGVIVPQNIEKELRKQLKHIRDKWEWFANNFYLWENWEINVIKNGKWRIIDMWYKVLHEIETSWNTYKHIVRQWIFLYKYSKIDLEKWSIDIIQYNNDIIRNNIHDRNEKIDDDILSLEKDDNFRKQEKINLYKLIDQQVNISEDDKIYLKSILQYKKNSRFKTYENILCIYDAINMMEKNSKYNEVLSVIYEILKLNLPNFLWKIVLDNLNEINILELPSVREFFKDHENKIDELFEYLKKNKEKLYIEYRFKNNNYNREDMISNFENMKKPREDIKEEIRKYNLSWKNN